MVISTFRGSALEALSYESKIVADSGDFESIKQYHPIDATTNPSLILNASQSQSYSHLVEEARLTSSNLVAFGIQILSIIPGRVSVEVDARLSYNSEETIQKALSLVNAFHKKGISKDRLLIKIAATWEGIEAAKVLEQQHSIHCNLTLIFNLYQAVACANAGVTLISPFVGRILDWYLKANKLQSYEADKDPGVKFVQQVFHYFKKFSATTEIMGASFRNTGEILQLAGLNCITISPTLLKELTNLPSSELNLSLKSTDSFVVCPFNEPIEIKSKNEFYAKIEDDIAAKELLAKGIDKFIQDTIKLEELLSQCS